jgi:hypothetical protein
MRGGRWARVALAVAVSLTTACIDTADDDEASDPSDTTQPSADETGERIAGWFTSRSDSNGLQFTADEAQCAAEGVVDGLGVARIEELRRDDASRVGGTGNGLDLLQEPPLDTDEADLVYRAMTGCIDFTAQVADVLVDGGRPPTTAQCMAERYLDTDVPRRAIMAAHIGPELMAEIKTTLQQVATTCTT